MRKFLYGLLAVIVVLGAVTAWLMVYSYTPSIQTPNSIAELITIDVNGDKQFLLIRDEDRTKPVLLFIHGGPGMPMMYLGYKFQRPLEHDFIVVQWDQRASGKSFHSDIDPATIRMSQMLADTETVVGYLRQRFKAPKIFMAGHSFGTVTAMLFAWQHPELLYSLVTIGQVADEDAARDLQTVFIKQNLAQLGLPADTVINGTNREDLLFQLGSEVHAETSMLPLILTGLRAPEYTLLDGINVAKGPNFYRQHMKQDVLNGPLMQNVTSIAVPLYMMMGKYDMTTPVTLARDYFDLLQAPSKTWIEFEESAHFPFYEEPERFAAEMRKIRHAALATGS